MSDLVNWKATKRLIMDMAKENRSHKYTCVSNSIKNELNSIIRNWAFNKVMEQPSKGKTIK